MKLRPTRLEPGVYVSKWKYANLSATETVRNNMEYLVFVKRLFDSVFLIFYSFYNHYSHQLSFKWSIYDLNAYSA